MSYDSSPVPVLTDDNFHEWKAAIEEYLTPYDDVRVITPTKSSMGALVDPVPPTDPDDLMKWKKSERIAWGVIARTATKLHLELVYKYKGGSVWELWKAIEARHAPQDAFLRYAAWAHLFSIRKRPDEDYMDCYRRVDDAHNRIVRLTPASLTPEQFRDEMILFRVLTSLPSDDPLRFLILQKNITLDDVYTACLRADALARMATESESANAVSIQHCYKCDGPGHLVKECPHSEAIDSLIAHRCNVSAGVKGGQRQKKKQAPMQT